jgi:phosphatidylinositol dimannoside acyltransferase
MTAGPPARSIGSRLRARAIVAASWLACRLPERPLLALADLAGDLAYRLAPERRRRARRNLARIAGWLAAHEMGTPDARAAARDGRALARLVRGAFRHSARYYVQLARAPIVNAEYLERRLVVQDRAQVEALLTSPGGKLFVGMHLGWFELPALIAVTLTGRPAIVPSETLADPGLQAYMVGTRERLGLRLIGLAEARRTLAQAIRDGEIVGLLGDRDLTGGGIDTELFGALAPLAAGPALLALETGVTPNVFGVWSDRDGIYHASMEPVLLPADGSRRERVNAFLAAEARVFERHIAAAPEQWLAVFHPIWPDLETSADRLSAATGSETHESAEGSGSAPAAASAAREVGR